MHTTHTIAATKDRPLYIPHYPLYNGRYAPHLFWHVTKPAAGDHPHQEQIWFSMYREEVSTWSNPKRISHKNATICLINYDTSQKDKPPKLSFASIYLAPFYPGSGYAGHPDNIPRRSLTNEDLHTDPTGMDIFKFYANPNHFFSIEQRRIISVAMLKRFPSDHPNYLEASNMWSLSNPNPPTQCETWLSRCNISHKFTNDAPTQPTTPIPPTQIIHTSYERPHVVQNYPFAYGEYRTARFWLETTVGTKTKKGKEVALIQTLNPSTNEWSIPKAASPAKATLTLLQIENNPDAPNFGLPFFPNISWNDPHTTAEMLFNFATNPNHYFLGIQEDMLYNEIMNKLKERSSDYPSDHPMLQQLKAYQATRPKVPQST